MFKRENEKTKTKKKSYSTILRAFTLNFNLNNYTFQYLERKNETKKNIETLISDYLIVPLNNKKPYFISRTVYYPNLIT